MLKIDEKELSIRTPLYHPDMPFVLFWSEKSGCTILAQWFFWQLGLLKEANEHHDWIHNYENEVFKAKSGYLKNCIKAIEDGLPVIKIVRNPYSRAFSGYLELCSKKVFETGHWARRQRRAILESLTGHFVEIDYGFSYRQYIEWLTRQAPYAIDPHIREQFMPIESKIKVEPMQLETGKKMFSTIEERFNLKKSAAEQNLFESGHHHTKTRIAPYPSIGFSELSLPVKRNGHFKLVELEIDSLRHSDLGRKIQQYFAKDFVSYGYDY